MAVVLTSVSNGTSATQSYTVPASTEMLVVVLSHEGSTLSETPTLTYGGVSMTRQVVRTTLTAAATEQGIAIFTLQNPTAGTANLVSTLWANANTIMSAMCANGIDTASPIGASGFGSRSAAPGTCAFNGSDASTAAGQTLTTTAAGSLILAGLNNGDVLQTVSALGGSWVRLVNAFQGPSSQQDVDYLTNGGAASTSYGTTTWTISPSLRPVTVQLEIKAAAGGGVGSAAGVATAAAVGRSNAAAAAAAAGVATAAGVGRSTAAASASAAGVATAAAVGRAVIPASATAAGTSTVTGVGAALAAGVGTAAGVATAAGVGASTADGSATGVAAGVATVTGVGSSRAASAASAAGVATATAVGRSLAAATGAAAGVATAAAVGEGGVPAPPTPQPLSGGGGGPASDKAYHARRKYEQDKRDKETRLWKGEPARAVPDKAEESPQVAAEVKETLTPEPDDHIDPLQALLDMIAAPDPILLTQPRPSRVFDPEDDVAVLLLSDF